MNPCDEPKFRESVSNCRTYGVLADDVAQRRNRDRRRGHLQRIRVTNGEGHLPDSAVLAALVILEAQDPIPGFLWLT